MMYITYKGYEHKWHVGESLPKITARVVTFQADCDELELILSAMEKTYHKQMQAPKPE